MYGGFCQPLVHPSMDYFSLLILDECADELGTELTKELWQL
jgi:hypothetical protein